jgi:hypothetical protein
VPVLAAFNRKMLSESYLALDDNMRRMIEAQEV